MYNNHSQSTSRLVILDRLQISSLCEELSLLVDQILKKYERSVLENRFFSLADLDIPDSSPKLAQSICKEMIDPLSHMGSHTQLLSLLLFESLLKGVLEQSPSECIEMLSQATVPQWLDEVALFLDANSLTLEDTSSFATRHFGAQVASELQSILSNTPLCSGTDTLWMSPESFVHETTSYFPALLLPIGHEGSSSFKLKRIYKKKGAFVFVAKDPIASLQECAMFRKKAPPFVHTLAICAPSFTEDVVGNLFVNEHAALPTILPISLGSNPDVCEERKNTICALTKGQKGSKRLLEYSREEIHRSLGYLEHLWVLQKETVMKGAFSSALHTTTVLEAKQSSSNALQLQHALQAVISMQQKKMVADGISTLWRFGNTRFSSDPLWAKICQGPLERFFSLFAAKDLTVLRQELRESCDSSTGFDVETGLIQNLLDLKRCDLVENVLQALKAALSSPLVIKKSSGRKR